ncbi:MAG: hypothetical protein ACKV22_02705 [Bryobacteraceae bacterium]
MSDLVIFGCGYTGRRVALRWRKRFPHARIVATARHPPSLDGVTALAMDVTDPTTLLPLREHVPRDALILHSIPIVVEHGRMADCTPRLLDALDGRHSRVVYLSTTGVYGVVPFVNGQTPVAPNTERVRLRVNAEQEVLSRGSSMVLRPAAIYGPGRGVHESMRRGDFRLIEGGLQYTSRIHVDDLAAHAEAALCSDLQGAFPVADDDPCPSAEVARFCSALLGLPMPPSVAAEQSSETRRSNRRVDGREIRSLLGVDLRYPSYRTGIPASLEEAHRV